MSIKFLKNSVGLLFSPEIPVISRVSHHFSFMIAFVTRKITQIRIYVSRAQKKNINKNHQLPMTDPWCCYIWCSMDPINKNPSHVSIDTSTMGPSWVIELVNVGPYFIPQTPGVFSGRCRSGCVVGFFPAACLWDPSASWLPPEKMGNLS